MRPLLPPYYHPTTVCFVDDNYAFMRSLALNAPANWSFISFTSPEEALQVINKPEEHEALIDRCFSIDRTNPRRPIMHLRVSELEQEIQWVQRFNRISTILIDYDMPTMSGLEFCEQIVDKNIRRGLFTGVADEKTAVAAFNKGLINRFIRKQDGDSFDYIGPQIEHMKQNYFKQFTSQITTSLSLLPPDFMTEPELVPIFEKILKKYNIVEFYLATEPYGYLLLRSDGTALRLVVLSAADLEKQAKLAEMHEAPARITRKLRKGKVMLYMFEKPEDYMGTERYPWEEMVIPTKRIEARQTWYVGIAENPPADIDFDPERCSFDYFLTLNQTRV